MEINEELLIKKLIPLVCKFRDLVITQEKEDFYNKKLSRIMEKAEKELKGRLPLIVKNIRILREKKKSPAQIIEIILKEN